MKPDISQKNIILMFIAANILVAVIFLMLLMPSIRYISNERSIIESLEHRYALHQRYEAEADINLLELNELNQNNTLIDFNNLVSILNELNYVSSEHDLRQLEFFTAEPIFTDIFELGLLFEKRIRISYEGEKEKVLGFLYTIDESFGRLNSFNIEILDSSRVTIDMSLFGIERY